MNNIEKLAEEHQPQIKPLWLVIDEQGYPIHCASYKEACNEHINDAINDFDLTDAKYWKVVEAEPKSLQSSEPVPSGYALVPIVPTKEMNRLMSEEDWEWKDLLAVAEAITEEQYNASTVSLEEHNKRIAELEAQLENYKRHYINACKGRKDFRNSFREQRATNKTLLDALKAIEFATKPEPDDGSFHENAYTLAQQAIADAEGVEG